MKRKHFFALLLTAALLLLAPLQAMAANGGTCGSNATWRFDSDTGLLTIAGEGQTTQYYPGNFESAPWHSYANGIRKVVIEEGITHINNCAFKDCANMTTIVIPHSLTVIGYSVFLNCDSLTTVEYSGTAQEWSDILVDDSGNDVLNGVHVNYNSSGSGSGTLDPEKELERPSVLYGSDPEGKQIAELKLLSAALGIFAFIMTVLAIRWRLKYNALKKKKAARKRPPQAAQQTVPQAVPQAAQRRQPAAGSRCPSCGSPLTPGSGFCGACGAKAPGDDLFNF